MVGGWAEHLRHRVERYHFSGGSRQFIRRRLDENIVQHRPDLSCADHRRCFRAVLPPPRRDHSLRISGEAIQHGNQAGRQRAVACLLFIFAKVEGGFAFIVSDGVRAGKFAVGDSTNSSWSSLLLLAFGSAVTNFNVYATDQQLVQRYMSTPSVRQAKAALWTSAIGGIPIAFLFFMIGTSLWAFYSQNPAIAPENKVVFAEFIARQLPPGMAGLLVAGLFAASMSTIDSGVNSICAAATTDFVRRFGLVRERNMLMFARILTLVVGAAGTGAAVVMSFHAIESMYNFFISVLGLFGGPLAGMFVLGIFARRCGSLGALSGAGVSAAIMLFIFFNRNILPVDDMLMGLLGLVICVITGYAVGLLTGRGKQPPRGLTIYSRDDGSTTALSEPCAAEISRRA